MNSVLLNLFPQSPDVTTKVTGAYYVMRAWQRVLFCSHTFFCLHKLCSCQKGSHLFTSNYTNHVSTRLGQHGSIVEFEAWGHRRSQGDREVVGQRGVRGDLGESRWMFVVWQGRFLSINWSKVRSPPKYCRSRRRRSSADITVVALGVSWRW